MKNLKKSLLLKIIIAIVFGVALGKIIPESIARIFVTFNMFFSNLLNFFIPLIIVGLIVPSVGKLGKVAGKILLYTVLIAYVSTLFSGLLGYFSSISIFPYLLAGQNVGIKTNEARDLIPYFTLEFKPFFDIFSALIFSFLIGLGLSKLSSDSVLAKFSNDFEKVITYIIQSIIIPLLPIFIFGIFLNMTHSGLVESVLNIFIKIIGVIFILHFVLLFTQFIIAGAIAKKNPIYLIKTMLPPYFTALGTQSSAATIPITLEQSKKMGVDENIANFTIPLCATIHLSGSMLKIVSCSIALMLVSDMPIYSLDIIGFILLLSIAMIAAPGVPGGAIMAAIGIIGSQLGFNTDQQALMIALYIAMDSFGTAANVTGDGAISLIINRIFSKKQSFIKSR